MKTLDCKTTLWYVIYYDLLTLFRFDTLTNEYKSEFHREILLETFNHVFKSSFDMSRTMVQLYDSFQSSACAFDSWTSVAEPARRFRPASDVNNLSLTVKATNFQRNK